MTLDEYYDKYNHFPLDHIEFGCERDTYDLFKYRVTFRRKVDNKYFTKLFHTEEGAIHRYGMISDNIEEYDEVKIWEVVENRRRIK